MSKFTPINNEFNNSKYTLWYFSIILNAKNRVAPAEYTEKHHILPASIYPQYADEISNIAILTAREHFLVHLLLPKCFIHIKNKNKMLCAIRRMKYTKNRTYNMKMYSLLKPLIVEAHRELVIGKPQRKRTETEKENLSKIQKEIFNNLSPEDREIRRKNLEETNKKTHIGRKRNKETGEKISRANKGRKKEIRMDKDQFYAIRLIAIQKCLDARDMKSLGNSISEGKKAANKKYSFEERCNLMKTKIFKNYKILYEHYDCITDENIFDARKKQILKKGSQCSIALSMKYVGYIPSKSEVDSYFK